MQRILHICLTQVLAASVVPCIRRAARSKTSLKLIINALDRPQGVQRPYSNENGGIVTALKKGKGLLYPKGLLMLCLCSALNRVGRKGVAALVVFDSNFT
jgi:hypothetical protein